MALRPDTINSGTHLIGSCALNSIGRGVPPGPKREMENKMAKHCRTGHNITTVCHGRFLEVKDEERKPFDYTKGFSILLNTA